MKAEHLEQIVDPFTITLEPPRPSQLPLLGGRWASASSIVPSVGKYESLRKPKREKKFSFRCMGLQPLPDRAHRRHTHGILQQRKVN